VTPVEQAVREALGLDLDADLLAAVQALKTDADTDVLTGLPNRRAFEREATRRSGGYFTVIDLDGFKLVNDEHGHEAGDEVLKHVARRLRSTLRADDFLARLGGDEFVIISDTPIPSLPQRLRAPGLPPVGVSSGSGRTVRGADRRLYATKGRRSR
jgi:GGDEF domain-containing protein